MCGYMCIRAHAVIAAAFFPPMNFIRVGLPTSLVRSKLHRLRSYCGMINERSSRIGLPQILDYAAYSAPRTSLVNIPQLRYFRG